MTIEFCAINKPEDWMEMVAEQFGTSVINDGFTIPSYIGSGFFKQYYPLPWLTLTYISFVAYEPITMIRRSVENSKWIPVMFYINEHKTRADNWNKYKNGRSGHARWHFHAFK